MNKRPSASDEWTQHIHTDYHPGSVDGVGHARGDDQDSRRQRFVRLFDQHGQPLTWHNNAKVGF